MEEVEVKFLDINPDSLVKKLEGLGAQNFLKSFIKDGFLII